MSKHDVIVAGNGINALVCAALLSMELKEDLENTAWNIVILGSPAAAGELVPSSGLTFTL